MEIGAHVLRTLEAGRGPLTLSQLAKASGLHPAKAHRYLVSLVRSGLASQDVGSGMYDLGPASRRLGVEALRRTDPVSVASAFAAELRDETGHTVNVAVWSESGPVIVRWDSGAHALPIVVRVGSTLPLIDSAVGQVFLSHLPRTVTTEVLRTQQHQSLTRRLSTAKIKIIIESVRSERFARTVNHMILGLAALAAPVWGADGELEVVIGLALPTCLLTTTEVRRLGPLLRSVADRASEELGFQLV